MTLPVVAQGTTVSVITPYCRDGVRDVAARQRRHRDDRDRAAVGQLHGLS